VAPEPVEREVGQVGRDVWDRFNRLQASVSALLGNRRHPGGVFRFRSFEELAQWNRQISLRPPEPPTPTTSSGFAGS
jgi:hypothetical protein